MSESSESIDPCLVEAIRNIETFVEETTGLRPGQEEIAQALSKYFVLKEILEFIKMARSEASV
ncbi:MAG: hypothetical protein D3926_24285 [Desulfobacteraceae bacterium]|nr:MAG: hypothetical protein D3926_24285 [Desulfobacteraceae bacterium]